MPLNLSWGAEEASLSGHPAAEPLIRGTRLSVSTLVGHVQRTWTLGLLAVGTLSSPRSTQVFRRAQRKHRGGGGPSKNRGKTLTAPITPLSNISSFWAPLSLFLYFWLSPQRPEETFGRFLVHSIICVAKHGAEISQYLKVFPAFFIGFQLLRLSAYPHYTPTHPPTHRHTPKTVKPFVCVGVSFRITFLKEFIAFIVMCCAYPRLANSQGKKKWQKGRRKGRRPF